MSEVQAIIPTFSGSLNGEPQTLVNAQELHQFLGVNTRFDNWIKRRIEEYGFTQAVDFLGVSKIERTEAGFFGSREITITDYNLSLDMAKELCMVERSDKGRAARRYFIEMEKRARALPEATEVEHNRLLWLVDELQDAYCKAHPDALKLVRYYQGGLNQVEMAALLGVSRTQVRCRLKTLATLGFIRYQAKAYRPRLSAAVVQQRLGLEG